ncbi:MAG: FHA domain-containing protein [Actinobacteria bacterium]|nr:FHA domain-containing protein [Actinomycetota bacterium]
MEVVPVRVRRRVSDAERDAAVRLLGDALADGRISTDTFIRRMDRTFASRDESSLDDVVADLVDVQPPPRPLVGARAIRRSPRALRAPRARRVSAQPAGLLSVQLPSAAQPVLDIGRSSWSEVCLGDPTVSSSHATLVLLRGGWVVVDRNATNGTFVNGRRVRGSARVRPGDVLMVGTTTLTLLASSQDGPSLRRRPSRWVGLRSG